MVQPATCDSVDRSALLRLVVETSNELKEDRGALDALDIDLANGLPGVALLFAYLARFADQKDGFANCALSCLESIADRLPKIDLVRPGIFSGITGIAWSMRAMAKLLDLREYQSPQAFTAVHEFVDEYLHSQTSYEFDLINGLAG